MKPHNTNADTWSRAVEARVRAHVRVMMTMWSRGCGNAFDAPIADQHTLVDGGPGSSG
jgi:hypothetical protein